MARLVVALATFTTALMGVVQPESVIGELLVAVIVVVFLPAVFIGGLFECALGTWPPRACAVFLGAAAGVVSGYAVDHAKMRASCSEAQPLIAAIQRYREAHGKPPAALDSLVPDYLAEIPRTRLRFWRHPDYSYHRRAFDPGSHDRGYYLFFECACCGVTQYEPGRGTWVAMPLTF